MLTSSRSVLAVLAALLLAAPAHAQSRSSRDDMPPPPAAAPLSPVKAEPLPGEDASPVLSGSASLSGGLVEIDGMKVRLAGADVPSTGESMSGVARDLLNTLIAESDVRCQVLGLDRDGERLARCSSKYSNDIAESMIRSGLAEYRRLPALSLELRAAYNEAESLARDEKIGLWKPGVARPSAVAAVAPPPARTPRAADLLAEADTEDMSADPAPAEDMNEPAALTERPAVDPADESAPPARPVRAARPAPAEEAAPRRPAVEAERPAAPAETPAAAAPAAPAPAAVPAAPTPAAAPVEPALPAGLLWLAALSGILIAVALPASVWLGIWGRRRLQSSKNAAIERKSAADRADRAQAYAIALQAEINALTLSLSTRADLARVAAQQPLEEVRRSLPSLMTRVPDLCLAWADAGLIGRRAAFTLRQLAVRIGEISERLQVLDAVAKNGSDRPAQRGDELQALAAEFDGAAQDARLVKELLQEFWTKPGNKRAAR